MKKIYYLPIICIATLLLSTCDKNRYGDPPQISVPTITSASIEPATFTYGDSVLLKAVVEDPETPLAELEVWMVMEDRRVMVATIDLRTGENSANVEQKVFVPLVRQLEDNMTVTFALTCANERNGTDSYEVTGLTGRRPDFATLYLVVDHAGIFTLTQKNDNKNGYETTAESLTLDKAFNYRIAQKIKDGKIDYSGLVWGEKNGIMQLVNNDDDGGSIFAFNNDADYTSALLFDIYGFATTLTGSQYHTPNLLLDHFDEQTTVDGEAFYRRNVNLDKNQEYYLYGELANADVAFNADFFQRVNDNKVQFLGEKGDYTLYYNPVRKNVIVSVENPAYPNYLVVCGYGLGYPTNIPSANIGNVYPDHRKTHTSWGFDHVLQYILFRKTEDNVYQGTVYMPGDHDHYADFKPFENTAWGNEKKAGEFQFTGEKIIAGDDNWNIPNGDNDPAVTSDNYRITINLNTQTVNITKFIL
jgi:hypothetical protein